MMQKTRILIVDDEPAFIRLLKINLERTGHYSVREENDATKALEAAEEFDPDVVLLDMVMPKLHGSDVAYALRSSSLLRETPIIFLTASAWVNGDSPALRIDGCTVISKPASMTQIIEAIEENLHPPVEQLEVVEAKPGSWWGLVSSWLHGSGRARQTHST